MKIQDLSGNLHEYDYIKERDYTTIEDRFLRNTYTAIDFLYRTNALTIEFEDDGEEKRLDIIDVLVADKVNDIVIKYANKNTYSPSTNTVTFYDTHGIKFRKNHKRRWFRRNKGFNSPVCLLSHELIHCYNEIYDTEDYLARKKDHTSRKKKIDYDGRDLSFPNAEEVFVIKMTNQVAKRLGEDKRSNYGRAYYATKSVLTTKKL